MIKKIYKYVKITIRSAPFFFLGNLLFICIHRLLQLGMDLSLKFATDSILSAGTLKEIVFPFVLFFITMMFGGNTGNMNKLFITMYTKNANKIFNKLFMLFAYKAKQDRYYDSKFYNEYEFVKKHINNTSNVTVIIFNNLLSAVVSVVITVSAITIFNPIILLFILILSVLMIVINYYIVQKKMQIEKEYIIEERKADYYSTLLSDKRHAKELRIFALNNTFLKKWENSFIKFTKGKYDFQQKSTLLADLPGLVEQIFSSVLILIFLYETMQGNIEVGTFVLLYRMMWRLTYGISDIIQILSSNILQEYKYIEKYDEVVGDTDVCEVQKRKNSPQEKNVVCPTEDFEVLEAKGICYSYPLQEGRAVDNVDFKIHKGELVAILGYNGSGKSTLTKILCGLLEDYEGDIFLNGRNYKTLSNEEIYPYFGFGFQDFTRYSFSLRDNIAIGCIEKYNDTQEIQNAVEKGNIQEIINKLPDGINTILGKEYSKEGQDLSIGQWQRIILARSYMGKPPLLILDEPTASIDPLEEMRMLKDFRNILEGNTAILVSHRIGFARICDRICIMDHGKIVEEGTHDSLLQKQGYYYHLYCSQKELYEEL